MIFAIYALWLQLRNGFIGKPLTFLVALKSFQVKADWFEPESRFSLAIQEESFSSNNGEPPFAYFDGATMMTFQYPAKANEVMFCLAEPDDEECDEPDGRGFNPEWKNFSPSNFEVKKSGVGENAGRGVFALVDIPAWSYLGLDEHVHVVNFEAETYDLIVTHYEASKLFSGSYAALIGYIFGYGFQHKPMVSLRRHLSRAFHRPEFAITKLLSDRQLLWLRLS